MDIKQQPRVVNSKSKSTDPPAQRKTTEDESFGFDDSLSFWKEKMRFYSEQFCEETEDLYATGNIKKNDEFYDGELEDDDKEDEEDEDEEDEDEEEEEEGDGEEVENTEEKQEEDTSGESPSHYTPTFLRPGYLWDKIPPPLPLIKCSPREEEIVSAQTVLGTKFPYISFIPPNSDTGAPLFNPEKSMRLSKHYSKTKICQTKDNNSYSKEQVYYYDNLSVDAPQVSFSHEEIPDNERDVSLRFNSFYESGNLRSAYRVKSTNWTNEKSNVEVHPGILIDKSTVDVIPINVEHEYDLYCQNDTHTNGHIQWYNFSMKNNASQAGMKVRINIVNMMKKDSLYNFGMKPKVYSEVEAKESNISWHNDGDDVCYYRNPRTYIKKKGKQKRSKYFYTLTFVYEFKHPNDTVYFAHCYPYTYTDLQLDLRKLSSDEKISPFLKKRELCKTLAGNSVHLLTITSPTDDPNVLKFRPGIIMTSRVHPGESNSSFIMKGVIEFLTGTSAEAQTLRDNFVFKLVPMINPDGVIYGNYRCSLAGCDLNRKYSDPDEMMLPEIFSVKQVIKYTSQQRGVLLYMDFHGHSRKKNVFLYGCDNAASESERIFPRVLPKMLSNICGPIAASPSSELATGFFSFRDCTFGIQKSKMSTGRVVAWNELDISMAYTLEASFCASGNNDEQKALKHLERLELKKTREVLALKLAEERRKRETEASGALNGDAPGVASKELRIDTKGATVEASNNDDLKEAEADALSPISFTKKKSFHFGLDKISLQDEARLEESCRLVASSYQKFHHYTSYDFQKIGITVCEALISYCNINDDNDKPLKPMYSISYKRKPPVPVAETIKVDTRESSGSGLPILREDSQPIIEDKSESDPYEGDTEDFPARSKRSQIRVISENEVFVEAFLKPAILEREAAEKFASDWERAKAERDVRYMLYPSQNKLLQSSLAPSTEDLLPQDATVCSSSENLYMMKIITDYEEHPESEAGSDSDPSGDNLNPDQLQKAWGALYRGLSYSSSFSSSKKKKKAKRKTPRGRKLPKEVKLAVAKGSKQRLPKEPPSPTRNKTKINTDLSVREPNDAKSPRFEALKAKTLKLDTSAMRVHDPSVYRTTSSRFGPLQLQEACQSSKASNSKHQEKNNATKPQDWRHDTVGVNTRDTDNHPLRSQSTTGASLVSETRVAKIITSSHRLLPALERIAGEILNSSTSGISKVQNASNSEPTTATTTQPITPKLQRNESITGMKYTMQAGTSVTVQIGTKDGAKNHFMLSDSNSHSNDSSLVNSDICFGADLTLPSTIKTGVDESMSLFKVTREDISPKSSLYTSHSPSSKALLTRAKTDTNLTGKSSNFSKKVDNLLIKTCEEYTSFQKYNERRLEIMNERSFRINGGPG